MKDDAKKRSRAVALLSGGLDSTVAAALAAETFRLVRGLFYDYGQHAARREYAAAGRVAERYGISLERIDLPWMGRFSESVLIEGKGEPPDPSSRTGKEDSGVPAEWVENRNGVFAAVGASIAASTGCSVIVTGFNAEEAESFPDNSEPYLDALNAELTLGTSIGVEIVSPTIRMTKPEIVREGLRLGIPWSDLWSCYRGGRVMCGGCGSCRRLRDAVAGTAASGLVHFEREEE